MTEVTDTHRRAGLRGREAVARRRINSGVRAGRVLGIVWGLASIVPLALREPRSLAVSIAFVAGILLATERMRRGSRVAACVLLALSGFVAIASGVLITVRVLFAGLTVMFANGVWGAFALARVRRDAGHISPAPARVTGERRPI